MMNNWYMLTLMGEDQKGIVAAVTQALFERDITLGETSMLRLGGNFTIMMMVAADLDVAALQDAMAGTAKDMGLTLHIDSMQGGLHQHITPNLIVRVSGADRAGIVARVTGALAEAGFNILDLESDVAGSRENPVYIMQIVGISETPLEELEAAVNGMRDEGIEVNISPLETLVG
jgi:glycine cleavage system transcriptional repressor